MYKAAHTLLQVTIVMMEEGGSLELQSAGDSTGVYHIKCAAPVDTEHDASAVPVILAAAAVACVLVVALVVALVGKCRHSGKRTVAPTPPAQRPPTKRGWEEEDGGRTVPVVHGQHSSRRTTAHVAGGSTAPGHGIIMISTLALVMVIATAVSASAEPEVHFHLPSGASDVSTLSGPRDVLDVSWTGFPGVSNTSAWTSLEAQPHYLVALRDAPQCPVGPGGPAEELLASTMFVSAGMATRATLDASTLMQGMSHWVCVVYYNGTTADQQLPTASVMSAEFWYDETPPGTEYSYAYLSASLTSGSATVSFGGFDEDLLGADQYLLYQYAIGTTPGGHQLAPLTTYGLVAVDEEPPPMQVTLYGLPLEAGSTVYATVYATNNASLVSSVTSDGVLLDSTPPQLDTLSVWHSEAPTVWLPVLAEDDGSVITFHWQCQDPETGIAAVRVCLEGISPCDFHPFEDLPPSSTSWSHSAFDLAGIVAASTVSSVRFIVEVVNGAGEAATASSVWLHLDGTSPSTGTVTIEAGRTIVSSAVVTANWADFEDDESGILYYRVGVHIYSHLLQISYFSQLHSTTAEYITVDVSDTLAAIPSPHGELDVEVAVAAVNAAGLSSSAVLGVASLDPTPPDCFGGPCNPFLIVRPEGEWETRQPGASPAPLPNLAYVDIMWGINDDELGLQSMYIAVGTTPGALGEQVFTAQPVPAVDITYWQTTILAAVQPQYDGVPLYVSLVATNPGNLTTVVTASQVVRVDSTPPAVVVEYVGTAATFSTHSLAWLSNSTSILPVVVRVHDAETAVTQVQVTVTDTATGQQWEVENATLAATVPTVVELQVPIAADVGAWLQVAIVALNDGIGRTEVNTTAIVLSAQVPRAQDVTSLAFVGRSGMLTATFTLPEPLSEEQLATVAWSVDVVGSNTTAVESRPALMRTLSASNGERTVEVSAPLQVANGMQYVARVNVTTEAGWTSTQASNTVTADTTPPTPPSSGGLVLQLDPGSPDTVHVVMSWNATFVDLESDVDRCMVTIGTTPGGSQLERGEVDRWAQVYQLYRPLAPTWPSDGPAISNPGECVHAGEPYYAVIRCSNHAGRIATFAMAPAVLDVTPPEVLRVSQGEQRDSQEASNPYLTSVHHRGRVDLSWEAWDRETGIVSVAACITTVNGTSLQPLTAYCDATGGVAVQLPDKDIAAGAGTVYNVSVIDGSYVVITMDFTNGAGLVASVDVAPALVDTQPPIAGSVEGRPFHASLGARTQWTSSTTELTVLWDLCAAAPPMGQQPAAPPACPPGAWQDLASGIVGFTVGIGSSAGEADVMPMIAVGLVQQHTFTRLLLEENAQYWASIEATDAAGWPMFGTVTVPLMVDTTPPLVPTSGEAYDGPGFGLNDDLQQSVSELCVSWHPFSDAGSGIVRVEVAFGIAVVDGRGGEQVVPYTVVESSLAQDAGQVAALQSSTRPTTGGLRYRTNATFDGSLVCLDADLQSGLSYYASVRATNGAGLTAVIVSDSVYVDGTAPYAPTPQILPRELVNLTDPYNPVPSNTLEVDLVSARKQRDQGAVTTLQGMAYTMPKYVTTLDKLAFVWEPWADLQTSVLSVRCGLGFRRDAFDLFDADVPVGMRVCDFIPHHLLVADGDPVFFVVEATNEMGIRSRVSSPQPVVVDSSPPVVGPVIVLSSGLGSSRCLSALEVQIAWDAFRDFDSGIAWYELALGTMPGEDDVLPWHDVGMRRNVVVLRHNGTRVEELSLSASLDPGAVSSLALHVEVGQLLYASVAAVNGAGLRSKELVSTASLVVCDEGEGCVGHRHRCMDGGATTSVVAERVPRELAVRRAVEEATTEREVRWPGRRFEGEEEREARWRRQLAVVGTGRGSGRGRRLVIDAQYTKFDVYWGTASGEHASGSAVTLPPRFSFVTAGATQARWYDVGDTASFHDCNVPPVGVGAPTLWQYRACFRALFYATRTRDAAATGVVSFAELHADGRGLYDNHADVPHTAVAAQPRMVEYRGFTYYLDDMGRVVRAEGDGMSMSICHVDLGTLKADTKHLHSSKERQKPRLQARRSVQDDSAVCASVWTQDQNNS